ncbi:MAG: alpha/beta hydrolase [Paracoccaceae bacterium]
MRLLFILIVVLWTGPAFADLKFIETRAGDYYTYQPKSGTQRILVIAHGTRAESERATTTARRYLDRWIEFAEKHQMKLIVPVFDDARFGNRKGGYGGYRGLFGKVKSADTFVLELLEEAKSHPQLNDAPAYLYGHSAGGQFAVRFGVKHPSVFYHTVLSAPGRYSFPDLEIPWPYGAGKMTRRTTWSGSDTQTEISGGAPLINYSNLIGRVSVVVGALDLDPQPKRPGHLPGTRIDTAHAWATAMSKADQLQRRGPQRIIIDVIPEVGHNSRALTPHAMKVLNYWIETVGLR